MFWYFFTPPPSLPLHLKLSNLTDFVKIKFRSDNKVHFYQFVFHGKWLSLAGPHASFYWSPRGSLRWLFSAKQCTNFQNIELFLKDNINFSSPISIMLDLSWFDLNLLPSSAKNKWKRRPVVLTKFCSSWDSDEYDELNVKSRNYYFSIFIYWKKFGAYKSKKHSNDFKGRSVASMNMGKIVGISCEMPPKMGPRSTYMPPHIVHAWSEISSNFQAIFFVVKALKLSFRMS